MHKFPARVNLNFLFSKYIHLHFLVGWELVHEARSLRIRSLNHQQEYKENIQNRNNGGMQWIYVMTTRVYPVIYQFWRALIFL